MVVCAADFQGLAEFFTGDSGQIFVEALAEGLVYERPSAFCAENDVNEQVRECVPHVCFLKRPRWGLNIAQQYYHGLAPVATNKRSL